MSALVNATTQQLKGEIERMKGLLEPANTKLAQAVAEKDKVVNENEQLMAEMEKMKKAIHDEEACYDGRLRNLESVILKSTTMASNIFQSVEAFQRHVLPNFRAIPNQKNKSPKKRDCDGSNKIVDEVHT